MLWKRRGAMISSENKILSQSSQDKLIELDCAKNK
jgi:hypothetical protein